MNRYLQLLTFLVLALGIYLIILYAEKKQKADFVPTLSSLDAQDAKSLRELCLTGRQVDRSRVCPHIIQGANAQLNNLAQACLRFSWGKISYLGKDYNCDDEPALREEIRQFTKALQGF